MVSVFKFSVSIIGGAFGTVGLVTGCVVDSAKAMAKKNDYINGLDK